ncbi:hypothetical protein ACE6H2_000239 [Prunus campanulata]
MQSDGSESLSPTTQRLQSLSAADTRGKHRIQAELKRLEQEARFLEVEKMTWGVAEESAIIRKSWNNWKRWTRPQLHARKHMALLIHSGIDGLKALKIQKVADAGYCDDHCSVPGFHYHSFTEATIQMYHRFRLLLLFTNVLLDASLCR